MKILYLILCLMINNKLFAGEFSYQFDRELEKSEFESLAKNFVTPLRHQFLPPLKTNSLRLGIISSNSLISSDSKNLINSASSQKAPSALSTMNILAKSANFNFIYSFLGYNNFRLWGFGLDQSLSLGSQEIAVRVGYTYLIGNSLFCAPSVSGEVIAKFNLLLFEIFGGAGLSQHKANYTPSVSSGLSSHSSNWMDFYTLGGLSFPFSDFIIIGAQTRLSKINQSIDLFISLSF